MVDVLMLLASMKQASMLR